MWCGVNWLVFFHILNTNTIPKEYKCLQYCLHTFDFTSAPNAALYMASSQRSPIKSEGIWPPAPGQRPALLTTTSVASLLASQEDRALPRGHLGWDDGHLQVAVCFAQFSWLSFKGSSRSRPLMVGSPSILAGGTLSTMWQAPTLSMGFYLWKGKSTTMYSSIDDNTPLTSCQYLFWRWWCTYVHKLFWLIGCTFIYL